jgi:PAS domain S-box-containing protein
MFLEGLQEEPEKLLRCLFEEASLGIAVEDTEGKLLLTNRALCSMLGYSNEELCRMSCAQFGHPEDSQPQ